MIIKSSRTIYSYLGWLGGILLTSFLYSCGTSELPISSSFLNSRYNDQQPALSGDGRLVAFVSNRRGFGEILLYDIQEKAFQALPGINPTQAVVEHPSLSLTGRYLVYLSTFQGRPNIVLYDREIRRAEILTNNYRGWFRNPRISPDGRYVVFETAHRGQWDIEVLDRGPYIELDLADGSPVVNP